MTEMDVEEQPEHSLPRFELEQSDDYSQFLLYSKTEILSVLRTLIQKGAMITAYFDQGRSFLLTSLVALASDNSEILLDISSNDEMNRKAVLADKLILTTSLDKVKIQFGLKKISAAQNNRRPAFRAEIPETLLRLQRREYFRLATPIASPVKCTIQAKRSDGSIVIVEAPLLDISGGGVGLMANPDQAELFVKGEILNDCKITLPDEGLLISNLSVRNIFSVTTKSGSRYNRIGCEFVALPGSRLTMVQRYITRVERERKARISGLS